ncbi:MAG: TRAP transporter substrate-binding protein, partial [Deltaproteobacteria bacterium]|nr:TRAP transporter substrate-binding protein [Deltaproteobacteria bacterium]
MGHTRRSIYINLMIISVMLAGIPSASAAPIKLTYSCFFPPSHVQSRLAEAWCKAVEKRTDGQVKIEYYPGQTLTKAKQCYDGTIYGLSDIGFSVFGYTRGRFPVMAAVDLPLGYTSGANATRVANAVYEKFNPKELRDTQVMYLHAHGPGLVHSRNKPILRIEDMKGMKFRSTGTSALVVQALGGTPVPKPMPEAYQMLQKGVVDGAFYPLESNKGWRLGEVVHYATAAYAAAYTTTFFVVMNKEKWAALPADVQQTITEINAEWAIKHGEAWDASDMAGIVYFLKQGGRINGMGKNEAARWRQAVAPV